MTVRSVIRGMNALVRERNTFQKSLAPLDNLGVFFFPKQANSFRFDRKTCYADSQNGVNKLPPL